MSSAQTIEIRMNAGEGVLVRLLGLVGRRGFEVRGVDASMSECGGVFRVALEVAGDRCIKGLEKQIRKLYDVVEVKGVEAGVDRSAMVA